MSSRLTRSMEASTLVLHRSSIGRADVPELIAFMNPYEVDGRVSWHAPTARGVATANCYLMVQGNQALLCDTGLIAHEHALLAQLRAAIHPTTSLSILVLRQGEFDSIGNLASLASTFGVTTVHGQYDHVESYADIHWRPRLRLTGPASCCPNLHTHVLKSADSFAIDEAGARVINVRVPRLAPLRTHWAFDHTTGTLFTSDFFSYVIRPSARGSWRVTEADDDTTEQQIDEHLLTTRYWWLDGAFLEDVRRDLASIFATFAVRRIAPAFGCILEGRNVVARHYATVDRLLARYGASRRSSPPLAFDHDRT